ncbi:hypothetical protein ACWEV4_26400 [Streptomyces sp. NPDC003860]
MKEKVFSTMLSKDQALEAAKRFLDEAYANNPDGWVMVVVAEKSYPYCDGWIAFFDTQEAIDSGNPWAGPISKVLVVPGDGSLPYFPPTHATADEFKQFRDTGVWPPHLRASS